MTVEIKEQTGLNQRKTDEGHTIELQAPSKNQASTTDNSA